MRRSILIRRPVLSGCVALTALAVACGSSGPTGASSIAAIRFASTDTIFLTEGASVQLAPQAYGADGQAVATTFSYAIASGGSSASVDSDGVVTGLGPGIAVAQASAGSVSANRVIAVFGHPAGTNQRHVQLGGRPYGVAIGADGSVFVTQLDSQTVTRLSLPALTVTHTIGVGQTPTGIGTSTKTGEVFVTNQFDPSVGIIDESTNAQVTSLTAPATTFRVILDRTGTHAYATATNGTLLVVGVAAKSVVGTIGILPDANGLAWDPISTQLYFSSMDGEIGAVDIGSGQPVGSAQDAGVLQDLAVAPDGSKLYVANESNASVDVFNLPSLTPAGSIALSAGAFGLTLTPDGSQIYVTQPSVGRVTIIDRSSQTVVANVDLNFGSATPRRVAFDRFGATAVVSDESGSVWVLN